MDGITAGLRDTTINSLDLGGVGVGVGVGGVGVGGLAGVGGVVPGLGTAVPGVGAVPATAGTGLDYDRNRYLASRRFVVGAHPESSAHILIPPLLPFSKDE